ncbi:hypothetical protein VUR80DRAFT_3250 [Thermomyces stellatus]
MFYKARYRRKSYDSSREAFNKHGSVATGYCRSYGIPVYADEYQYPACVGAGGRTLRAPGCSESPNWRTGMRQTAILFCLLIYDTSPSPPVQPGRGIGVGQSPPMPRADKIRGRQANKLPPPPTRATITSQVRNRELHSRAKPEPPIAGV